MDWRYFSPKSSRCSCIYGPQQLKMQKCLTKYIHKDIALIITAYAETDTDYYQSSHYVTYQFILRTVTPTITRGVRLGPDIYYIMGSLQKITGNIIKPIMTPTPPCAIAICDMYKKIIFIVSYELSIIIYNCDWKPIYTYYHTGHVYTCTSSTYGSALYLAHTYYVSENSNMPYGELIKLICVPSGKLYELKRIRQAPNSQVLASNIDYVCVKAGNKVIIYHADTLQKVARVNIGMAITDGIIKDNNLILRHNGQMQIMINLITWKKHITQLKYIMLPDKVFLKNNFF
jgi:hypothetical protein